jgi:hypothetical protein
MSTTSVAPLTPTRMCGRHTPGFIVEEALTGARPAPEGFVLQETVVMRPAPAAIPATAPAAKPGSAPGLTSGAPLGASDISDGKRVAG